MYLWPERGIFKTEARNIVIIVYFWGLLIHSPDSFHQHYVYRDPEAA